MPFPGPSKNMPNGDGGGVGGGTDRVRDVLIHYNISVHFTILPYLKLQSHKVTTSEVDHFTKIV